MLLSGGLQIVDKSFSGGLEGPQALQSGFVSPGFAGRAGSLHPWAQTFLKLLAEKAGAGGLFRQAKGPRRDASLRGPVMSGEKEVYSARASVAAAAPARRPMVEYRPREAARM